VSQKQNSFVEWMKLNPEKTFEDYKKENITEQEDDDTSSCDKNEKAIIESFRKNFEHNEKVNLIKQPNISKPIEKTNEEAISLRVWGGWVLASFSWSLLVTLLVMGVIK
jgi:hypothetical protein